MRKFAGVLVAAALIVPAAMMAAPGGAAATKPTCTKLTGTATFKPPLPKVGSTAAKVKPTITIKGAKLSGCTGGGVTGGVVGATLKFGVASNCADLLGGKSTKTAGTVSIKWNTLKTTTVKATLKGVTGNATQQTVTGPITTGQFKPGNVAATTQFTPGAGQCGSKDLSSVTFALVKGKKLTIK